MSSALRQAYTTESFTEVEAKAKVGKTVRLLTEHNHLHEGMTGYVVDFHETLKENFEVVIRWDLPNGSEPVHKKFSKSKYYSLFSEE